MPQLIKPPRLIGKLNLYQADLRLNYYQGKLIQMTAVNNILYGYKGTEDKLNNILLHIGITQEDISLVTQPMIYINNTNNKKYKYSTKKYRGYLKKELDHARNFIKIYQERRNNLIQEKHIQESPG